MSLLRYILFGARDTWCDKVCNNESKWVYLDNFNMGPMIYGMIKSVIMKLDKYIMTFLKWGQ